MLNPPVKKHYYCRLDYLHPTVLKSFLTWDTKQFFTLEVVLIASKNIEKMEIHKKKC